jgi:phosphoglycolate phosphatase-like HAD superfamily hydrolase
MPGRFDVMFWDFDGVLLNSNEVRDRGFTEVLKDYPAHEVAALLDFHHQNGGLSRYVKFRYFFETIRKETLTDEKLQQLASSFSLFNRRLLVNPELLIGDSMNFVRKHFQACRMHIVSGSDENELRYLCEQLQIEKYFRSIHGSPKLKEHLIREVIDQNAYDLVRCVLIGDSVNDFDAAQKNHVHFIGYNNAELAGTGPYITSFEDAALFS